MEKGIFITRTVSEADEGADLVAFLGGCLADLHKASLRELVREGYVQVDGRPAGENHRLRASSRVVLQVPAALSLQLRRRRRRGPRPSLLYEDPHCLVVDKPAGVPVIPERHRDVATLRDLLPGGGDLRIVHRLDRETSGCLLLARTLEGMRSLERQFRERRVAKRYLALVRGQGEWGEKVADQWLGPAGGRANRMQAVDAGRRARKPHIPCKEALTHYRILESFPGYSLVEARPRTGRTHQVRVHLAAAGLPLVADPLYGKGPDQGLFLSEFKRGFRPKPGVAEKPLLGRLGLHAAELSFTPPAGEEPVQVAAPPPADLARALAALRHYLRGRLAPGTRREGG